MTNLVIKNTKEELEELEKMAHMITLEKDPSTELQDDIIRLPRTKILNKPVSYDLEIEDKVIKSVVAEPGWFSIYNKTDDMMCYVKDFKLQIYNVQYSYQRYYPKKSDSDIPFNREGNVYRKTLLMGNPTKDRIDTFGGWNNGVKKLGINKNYEHLNADQQNVISSNKRQLHIYGIATCDTILDKENNSVVLKDGVWCAKDKEDNSPTQLAMCFETAQKTSFNNLNKLITKVSNKTGVHRLLPGYTLTMKTRLYTNEISYHAVEPSISDFKTIKPTDEFKLNSSLFLKHIKQTNDWITKEHKKNEGTLKDELVSEESKNKTEEFITTDGIES